MTNEEYDEMIQELESLGNLPLLITCRDQETAEALMEMYPDDVKPFNPHLN